MNPLTAPTTAFGEVRNKPFNKGIMIEVQTAMKLVSPCLMTNLNSLGWSGELRVLLK